MTGKRYPSLSTTARALTAAFPVVFWALTAGAELEGEAGPAQQGDEEEPTPAVMAPLADRAMVTSVSPADGRLIAVGERGHILSSQDGRSWEQLPSPVDEMLTSVTFSDAEHGWAVGHASTILHTANGGEKWQVQRFEPGKQQTFLDVLFTDRRTGHVAGAFGLYLATEDGGKTWTKRDVAPDRDFNVPHLNDVMRTADGTLYIAAEFGIVYRSEDGGESWEELKTPYEGSYFEILNPSEGRILVAGLRGNAFYSGDRGESWTRLELPTGASIFGGTVLEDGGVVLVGQNASILTNRPGGTDFHLHKLGSGNTLSSAHELADGDLLVTDQDGPHVVPRAKLRP